MGHGLIAWIIIGVIAGWLTGKLMKGSGFGFFMDMIVGLVGALVGGFLSSHLGMGGVDQHCLGHLENLHGAPHGQGPGAAGAWDERARGIRCL